MTEEVVAGVVVGASVAARRFGVHSERDAGAVAGEERIADATQVLVCFAVAKLGDPPLDGKTDTNPEGLTAATGKWAAATAARFHAAGLSCKVLDAEEFRAHAGKTDLDMRVHVGWREISGCTVGVVEKEHRDEVAELIDELAGAAAAEMGVEFDSGVVDRLCAYARSIAHFPTAVKEFEWRNGWFYEISRRALESGRDMPFAYQMADRTRSHQELYMRASFVLEIIDSHSASNPLPNCS
ncbi:hypothetical protein M758_6G024300 [Ceratodon purpureus]|uniref:Uncharacterized protein n=1 Tax=Ceratodon purpureus TaxID=3225 RepID=A0A8T0HHC9_CERPU|nr:hypothetical protein KC19_N039900 [Ceratodon purpureus]KAG0568542.1 hypothetical protein KC19_6G027200 [Ceratodon purpureus]KAG0612398.1 hypothetical protein M758_6G024300 [Ceratodon purpureus]